MIILIGKKSHYYFLSYEMSKIKKKYDKEEEKDKKWDLGVLYNTLKERRKEYEIFVNTHRVD
jgi:uncharacterized membrane protein